MKIEQVAIQLYTLRDFLKTPQDIAATLKRVKEIGFKSVQASGLGPIPEPDLVKIISDLGLTLCATHEGDILENPKGVADRLKKLNCRFTAYPYPAKIPLATLAEVKAFAKRLNESGRILHDNGCVLTYHNHSIEFRKVEGAVILDVIYNETDARYLQGEIDTYWVQHGGADPAEWCARLKNRLPLLHMKDYRINQENKPDFAEIGSGNLNWKKIAGAAEGSGCEWYIIEQDTCPDDPFKSIAISLKYVKENLCI